MKRLILAVSLLGLLPGCSTPADKRYVGQFQRLAPNGEPAAITGAEYVTMREKVRTDWRTQRITGVAVDLAMEVIDARRSEGLDHGK